VASQRFGPVGLEQVPCVSRTVGSVVSRGLESSVCGPLSWCGTSVSRRDMARTPGYNALSHTFRGAAMRRTSLRVRSVATLLGLMSSGPLAGAAAATATTSDAAATGGSIFSLTGKTSGTSLDPAQKVVTCPHRDRFLGVILFCERPQTSRKASRVRRRSSPIAGPAAKRHFGEASAMMSETISHYRILRKRGWDGRSLSGQDARLDRNAAIKVLPPEAVADERARKRLLGEA